MSGMKPRIGILSIILLAIAIVSIRTLVVSAQQTERLKKEMASPITDSSPGSGLSAARINKLAHPDDLVKTEEFDDPTFGHVVSYSDENPGPYERVFWLQTWNPKLESVEAYGLDKNWWLESTKSIPIVVGDVKAELSAQADSYDGSQIQWYKITWRAGDTAFRLVSRNLHQKELESIISSTLVP